MCIFMDLKLLWDNVKIQKLKGYPQFTNTDDNHSCKYY